MKTLKLQHESALADFNKFYKDSGCSCHLSPPCAYCVHEGNPINLAELDGAWEETYDIGDCGIVVSEFHYNYAVNGATLFGKKPVHLTFAAYSVRAALYY